MAVVGGLRAGVTVRLVSRAVAPGLRLRPELTGLVVRQRIVEHVLIHTEHHGTSGVILAGWPRVARVTTNVRRRRGWAPPGAGRAAPGRTP